MAVFIVSPSPCRVQSSHDKTDREERREEPTTYRFRKRSPTDLKPVQAVERSLAARIRQIGLGVQTEPLREMRFQMGLDVQLVYFKVHMPIRDGVTLRLPVMATFAPRFYSPTRAQQPDRVHGPH
jgi:hypothetical protein